MLAKSDDHIEIAQIEIQSDTGKPLKVSVFNPSASPQVVAAARRYLTAARANLEEADEILHFIYDPSLKATTGAADRKLMFAKRYGKLVEAFERATDLDVTDLHTFVVINDGFASTSDLSDDKLREIVAMDLSSALDNIVPLNSNGPIQGMMPWMIQIAGSIILPGSIDGAADEAAIKDRAWRAVTRAWDGFCSAHYPDARDKHGLVQTHYPAFLPLAQAVGRNAAEIASDIDSPLPRDMALRSLRMAISQAAQEFDVTIAPTPL